MALSADRTTPARANDLFEGPMAASAECFAGAMLVQDASGNTKPAVAAGSLTAVGRCEEYAIESTAVAGASNVKYRAGTFRWANSGTNTLTKADIGSTVYIEDDQTVGSSGSGTSPAGIMVDIDTIGVWVLTDASAAASLGLLAANNLSDVALAATARTNLGLGTANTPTFADVTTTDDVIVGDDCTIAGLTTVGETLAVTGITTCTAGVLPGPSTLALLKSATTVLTATQIKALATTGISLVAAVANKMHVVLGYQIKLTYGSEVLVEPSAPDELQIRYVDKDGTPATGDIDATAIIAAGVDSYASGPPAIVAGGTLAALVNVALVIANTGTDYTGNASDDAELDVTVMYMEVDVS